MKKIFTQPIGEFSRQNSFVFLIPWLGFTFGVGLGAYTAWGNKE